MSLAMGLCVSRSAAGLFRCHQLTLCSIRGVPVDLAGPFANLLIGLVALWIARSELRLQSATRLLFILVAAFNLLWLSLQLVFSAATRTDDWAWAMHQYGVSEPVRYALIVIGALAYMVTVRATSLRMAPFAQPRSRARTIALTVWLTAGGIACATAIFDRNVSGTLLRHALEQSLGLSIGLLFVPARAALRASPDRVEAPVPFSISWTLAATGVGAASILFLGPGVALPI